MKSGEEAPVVAQTATGEVGDSSVSAVGAAPLDGGVKPASLPAGMVTFVLTDIEGSTRLFHKLGDGYVELLATHHALLRTAFEGHAGVEVSTEGDSLLVAFPDAVGAVAGCVDGQRALAAQVWAPDAEVRVRMGVHTGEATPVGHDYVAIALHQVARISAGAHGSQVLVSEATAAAVDGRLPLQVTLVALGSFHLRGFPTPERLFQVRHPDLRNDFPPLRAIGVVAHNLPFLRSSFVGRAEERSALAGVLRTTGVVSVVGVGGVGKTRLALQVAFDVLDGFADGAWLVELASLTDPASVPRAVAAAVGVAVEAGRSADDAVVEALGPRAVLLVLDNCEHLLDSVASLAERLSQRCPNVVILATSREPLDIEGEVVWRIGPLPTVDPKDVTTLAAVADIDSVQLFAARATLAHPGFELTDGNAADVARIVAHLNGIPLAIELAAAALSGRSLAGVLNGLTDRFALLTDGRRTAPDRHQTLRAALEWSLDLLREDERRLLSRLAVFAGSGTTEAAVTICAGGPVESGAIPGIIRHLIRASLLVAHEESPDRWSMLESIRELAALELAAAGEAEELASRHRNWYAGRVEDVADDLGRGGWATIMSEFAADHDNVRRAIDDAVATRDAVVALRISAAMAPFWTSHGDWTEGRERLRSALGLSGADESLRNLARLALGNLLLLGGEFEEAEALFAEARAEAVIAGDEIALARALAGSGYVAFRHSELGEAQSLWEDALVSAERAGDARVAANILRSLAIAAGSAGDQAGAKRLLDRAIALAQSAEDDQLLRLLLASSAELQLWLGHYREAEEAYGDALTLAASIGDLSARPLLLAELGWVALLRGDPATAERLSIEAIELAEDLGNPRVLAHALRLQGEALMRRGGSPEAVAVLDRALEVAEDLGAPAEVAGVRCSQACLALDGLDLEKARQLAEEARSLSALEHPMRRTSPFWVLGTAALLESDEATAARRFQDGSRRAVYAQIPRHEANNLWGLAGVAAAAGRNLEAAELHLRALELRYRMGDQLGVVDSLIGLATVAAAAEPKGSAALVGAATALRKRAGAIPTAFETAGVEAALTAISDAAGPKLVAKAKEPGDDLAGQVVISTAVRIVEEVRDRAADEQKERGHGMAR